METNIAAMSHPMSAPTVEKSHLVRKLVLLFLLEIASVFGLLLMVRAMTGYPVWFQNWYAVVTLAVVAGFGTRWVLTRRFGLIRSIVSLAVFIVGLYLLGFVSEWKYGLGPLEFWSDRVDTEGLIQVGVGALLLILTSLAWKQKAPAKAQPASPPAEELRIAPQPPPIPRNIGKTGKLGSILDSLKPKLKKTVKVGQARGLNKKSIVKPASGVDQRPHLKYRNPFKGKPKVRLAIVEEHRCPFCLEPVSRVDPRGVVECEVCHTLHHKDCWDVTGVCQVPHMNS